MFKYFSVWGGTSMFVVSICRSQQYISKPPLLIQNKRAKCNLRVVGAERLPSHHPSKLAGCWRVLPAGAEQNQYRGVAGVGE